jgi:hypothetical protein
MEQQSLTWRQKLAMVEAVLRDSDPRTYHQILDAAARDNPWRPRRTGWANVLDQVLHTLYAALVLLPALVWFTPWGAALSGSILGALREFEQLRNQDLGIHMVWDRLTDIAFFAIGAALTFVIFVD